LSGSLIFSLALSKRLGESVGQTVEAGNAISHALRNGHSYLSSSPLTATSRPKVVVTEDFFIIKVF
jgi:hypothetical protein